MSSNLESQAAHEASFLGFLGRQFLTHPKPIPPSLNLAGQTAMVTGANVGLGLECLRTFLELGLSHAILAVRNRSKGDVAAAGLRQQFPNAQIDVMIVDMASYDSIRAFIEECKKLDRLDIAILNAGMQAPKFALNADTGHETTLQINYISTMYLAALLVPIPKTKKRPGHSARLSLVGSDSAFWAKLDTTGPIFAQFDSAKNFSSFKTYTWSKLLLIAGMIKLAELVNSDDVIVNVVNPGACVGTAFGQNGNKDWLTKYVLPLMAKIIGRTVKTGALTYVDGAIVQGKESHGSYCSDWTIKPYPGVLYTREGEILKERLWEETSEELHLESILNGSKS
ncbi:retinol dehydrogenase 12 [Coniochaeta sp. PMI_546]|nr:retinol dehydrogenase 12 [Coniochaeta sp. PMI_546]